MDRDTRAVVLFWSAVIVLGATLTARRVLAPPAELLMAAVHAEPARALAANPLRETPPGADSALAGTAAPARSAPPGDDGPLPPSTGQLVTENASHRSGFFHFPARTRQRAVPLLVAIHGQGGDGRDMIAVFERLADSFGFAVLAPSSRYATELASYTWSPGDKPNDITPDFRHVQACLDELRVRPDIRVNPDKVLIAGFSAGGSTAPYVATNVGPYEAFAILHGGVFKGGLGARHVRAFLSTGKDDPARTPAMLHDVERSLTGAATKIVYKEYPGGHALSSDELADLVEWWLHGG